MKKFRKKEILTWAKKVLETEKKGIDKVARHLDKDFLKVIRIVSGCKGRIVVTGMGKAGIIGQKFSATLSSTGSSSFWLHPTEAVHGDLGSIRQDDVVVVLSYSGETDEVKNLIPFIKKIGVRVIAITGNIKSSLARYADSTVNVKVDKEACPLGLAPTTSTTAMLAICDAISVVLQKVKGFKEKDFAFYHPKGSLGRKLLLKVEDCMRKGIANPIVSESKLVSKVLEDITKARAGAAVVVNKKKQVIGIFTDGDLRRCLTQDTNLTRRPINKVMTRHPIVVSCDMLASQAMRILEEKKIDEVPVVDKKGKIVGLLDVQDLLRAGVV